MKIYIAGSSKRIEYVREVMNTFREANFEITCDWTKNVQQSAKDPSLFDDEAWCESMAVKDLNAIEEAEAIVVLIYPSHTSRGTYFEMGYATKLGLPIFIVGGNRDDVIFHNLPNVTLYDTISEVMLELRK